MDNFVHIQGLHIKNFNVEAGSSRLYRGSTFT